MTTPRLSLERLAQLMDENDADLEAARAMRLHRWVETLTKRAVALQAIADRMPLDDGRAA